METKTKPLAKDRLDPNGWKFKFIAAMEQSPSVSRAARIAGIARPYAYEARKADPVFAEAWADARQYSIDGLEAEAFRRAKDGVEKPVYHQGVQVGSFREYSDQLLIFLLRAHKPKVYGRRAQIQCSICGCESKPRPGQAQPDPSRWLVRLEELGIGRTGDVGT